MLARSPSGFTDNTNANVFHASLKMNFNPYIYIIDGQLNIINYLQTISASYPYKMDYFISNGGIGTAMERT